MYHAIITRMQERQVHVNSERTTIKGIRHGLLVTLGEGGWRDVLETLEVQLGENPAFFRGGRIALDVRDRILDQRQIEEARSLVARHQVEMWALMGSQDATRRAAREAGLVVDVDTCREPEAEDEPLERRSAEAVVVRRTLRSGQTLRHPGDVVVIGDVNPGAEIVAGGDIVVWGRVRGLVHAGALGSEDAVICALDLAPTQLRIGGRIARSPEEGPREPMPEMVSVRDGQIVAVPWPGEWR